MNAISPAANPVGREPKHPRKGKASALSLVAAAALGVALHTLPGDASAGAADPVAPDGVVASPEPGWPQWRGIRRDGVSREAGLLPAWPDGGPPRLWTVSGLGAGYSSPIITRGAIYITSNVGDDLVIFAFDLDGKPLWQAKNGASWTKNHPGARSSCTYLGGRIYHMNAHGRVACLDAATGRERWAVTLRRDSVPRYISPDIGHDFSRHFPAVYLNKPFVVEKNLSTVEDIEIG